MNPKIDALKAALAASTAGEWEAGLSTVKVMHGDNEMSIAITSGMGASTIDGRHDQAHFDAKFIALAHNELPALLDYVARLEGKLAEIAEFDVEAEFGFVDEWNEAAAFTRVRKIAREALASADDGG